MSLLPTDIIAIIIALLGLIYVTFSGMLIIRKLEIENRQLRKENLEMEWNQIKI